MRGVAAMFGAGLLLAACAGEFDPHDDSGLEPPPYGSGIPNPHAGAERPSSMLEKLKRGEEP